MKPNKVYSIEVRPNSAVQDDQEKNRGNTFFKKPFTESLKKSRASYDGRLTTSNIVLDKILLENNCSHSRWYLLYAILGPLACFLMDYGAFVLWPMKNAFLHPETWSALNNIQIDKTFNCYRLLLCISSNPLALASILQVDVYVQVWNGDDEFDVSHHTLLCRGLAPC